MATLPIDLTDDPIAEEATARIDFTVTDEDGVGIPAASLDGLTVTLFEERSGQIINSRTDVNILNANGGTVDANGVGTWLMDPDDNVFVAGGQQEYHVALFEWTFGGGSKDGKQPVRLKVINLQQVP
jgi:hypothetical protein